MIASDSPCLGRVLRGINYSLTLNVLQGDVDKSGGVVAADYSDVKKRFFKSTTSTVTGTSADYSAFHDVDGSGSILANDYSEVKKLLRQPARGAGRPRQHASTGRL